MLKQLLVWLALCITTSADEPESHVYGIAGTAETFYNGVEKSFGSSAHSNPEMDLNPDPSDPLIYEKGSADATSPNIIYPMASAGEGIPSNPELQKPDGELNSLQPVSKTFISQRRGSQLTSIGAGSGAPEDQIQEKPQGRLFKRRLLLLLETSTRATLKKQQWTHNSMEGGDVGSGLAVGSSRIVPASPFEGVGKKKTRVVPFLTHTTVGLDEVQRDPTPEGPTTRSVYPKWMSSVGSDPIVPPKVNEFRQRMRGSNTPGKGWIDDHLPMKENSVGQGIGEKVDQYGFPMM